VFGDLALVEYVEPSRTGDSRGSFRCSCGTIKQLRFSNVASGATTHCADRTQHRNASTVPHINSAHAAITRLRGPAKKSPCGTCGLIGPGNQWAYRHSSLDPLVQQSGKDAGQVYSTDPADYIAMCRKHHAAFDRAHKRLHVPAGQVSGFHHIFALAYDPYGDTEHPASTTRTL
jgi:hypothetical protein